MNTISISITVSGEAQEILISDLEDLGSIGFEQKEEVLIAYFPELNFNSYEVNSLLQGYQFVSTIIHEQNWNALWESNFPPVAIERFCYVRAGFHPPDQGYTHEILITPKMSFGTGHHATTYMMIRQMKDLDLGNKQVFDFGTGTGILAILAEKMGAATVEAIDIDEWSICNAVENGDKNQCSKIRFEKTTVLPAMKFDVVLANINRNVILDYLEDLVALLNPGSIILFSGLMISDEQEIMQAFTGKLKLLKREEKDNWIALCCSA
ncbi:MAG: 50S ribosomal protein L11 methyltransferase [Flavisolibacter sp.]|nr:50S ribosomal protein L11 methyltransferase [Flavisolibacter sp.]